MYVSTASLDEKKEVLRSLHRETLDLESFMGIPSAPASITKIALHDASQWKASENANLELEKRLHHIHLTNLQQENRRLLAEKDWVEKEREDALEREQLKYEAAMDEAIRGERDRIELKYQEALALEREQAEKIRIDAVRVERERAESVKAEAVMLERERGDVVRLDAIREERERAEVEKAEMVRLERERNEEAIRELARIEQEKFEKARLEALKMEREKFDLQRVELEARELAMQLQKETSSRLKSLTASSHGREMDRKKSYMLESKLAMDESERQLIKLKEEDLEKARLQEEVSRKLELEAAEKKAQEKANLEGDVLLKAEELLKKKREVRDRLQKKEVKYQEEVLKKKLSASPVRLKAEKFLSAPEESPVPVVVVAPIKASKRSYMLPIILLIIAVFCGILTCFQGDIITLPVISQPHLAPIVHQVPDITLSQEIPLQLSQTAELILEEPASYGDVIPESDVIYVQEVNVDRSSETVALMDQDIIDDAPLENSSVAPLTLYTAADSRTVDSHLPVETSQSSPLPVFNVQTKSSRWSMRRIILGLVKLPFRATKFAIVFFFGLA
jgi:hypothetical protein